MAVNWPNSSKVDCYFESNLEEDAQNIVLSRFSQAEEEEEEEEEER
ncbi:MAG: hypothetical protein JNN26_27305 [Candidatus Obscuribacter sp.]|nr:hypothetical protein [Candidatus Obscuribacter sp.]